MVWWWSPSKHAKKIVRCSGEVIMRRIVLTPQEPRRATLVEHIIELPSLVDVGSCGTRRAGLAGDAN
jgi:hypothetical protein